MGLSGWLLKESKSLYLWPFHRGSSDRTGTGSDSLVMVMTVVVVRGWC